MLLKPSIKEQEGASSHHPAWQSFSSCHQGETETLSRKTCHLKMTVRDDNFLLVPLPGPCSLCPAMGDARGAERQTVQRLYKLESPFLCTGVGGNPSHPPWHHLPSVWGCPRWGEPEELPSFAPCRLPEACPAQAARCRHRRIQARPCLAPPRPLLQARVVCVKPLRAVAVFMGSDYKPCCRAPTALPSSRPTCR